MNTTSRLAAGCLLVALLSSLTVQTAKAQNAFARYYATAKSAALNFPQEKAYLRFDNTSYYQGDTIWFKAYVVTAADNRPTPISKPLYVELLDQLGNRMERKTIKIDNGQGRGCFILSDAFITGYYEVRAYTKWMLAFDDSPCFSRVLPIYRKRLSDNDAERSIATYRSLDKSMKQRPVEKEKRLNVRFFPESGNLVKGLTSTVAFEIASRDSGAVNLDGFLYTKDKQPISPIKALHDGRGSFSYTPGDKPAQAVFSFNGKKYTFDLPEASDHGYVMHADNHSDDIFITLSRSSTHMHDSLAVFLFCQGIPVSYAVAHFKEGMTCQFKFPKNEIRPGVVRFALINAAGHTLADRFCFVPPRGLLSLTAATDKAIYSPYEKINCTLQLKDGNGQPLKNTPLTLSIRNGNESDYREFDDNAMTDLLLTSDLRGYIDRPGYYFKEDTPSSRMMLDQLLIARGWRRYDIESLIGIKPMKPQYMPETTLTLNGQVKSLFNRPQSHIIVSIMAKKDSTLLAGSTMADEKGYFSIPVDAFEGNMETVLQTRREGKKYNRWTHVRLFRNFEPQLREYGFAETHPKWTPMPDRSREIAAADSIYESKILANTKLIAETTVTAKRKNRHAPAKTEEFERDIIGYYPDIQDFLDQRADEGKEVYDLKGMLEALNSNIHCEIGDTGDITVNYRTTPIHFYTNAKRADWKMIRDAFTQMKSIMLYRDVTGGVMTLNAIDSTTFRIKETEVTDLMADTAVMGDNSMQIVAAITMAPGWDVNRSYMPRRGLRLTKLQGYEKPLEFYSPVYADSMPVYADRRRTLYWNPDVMTDENGVARIECWNGSSATQILVEAETLTNGSMGSVTFIPHE